MKDESLMTLLYLLSLLSETDKMFVEARQVMH